MCDFQQFFNAHPTPTWIYSVRTLRILAVNDAAVCAYGYSRAEFLQMTIEQIRPVDDVSRLHEHLRSGQCADYASSVWRHRRKDGTCIYVEIESTAIDFCSEAARLVAARNVSEQVINLQRLNLAVSSGHVAIWEYKPADASLSWDPTNTGVYGIDRALFPKNQAEFLQLVEPRFRMQLEEALRKCVDEGELYDCEFQLDMPLLGLRWRHAIGKRVEDSEGVKVMGIGIDVTDRKKLEEQIHRSQKLEAVGRLASGVAHDFNNLLTIISGYAQLITSERDIEFVDDAASEISTAAERGARLVRQLLDFSRTTPVDPQSIDVSKVVAETASMLRPLLPESLQLDVQATDRPLSVTADPGQIEQLVMNLCLNARDAMKGRGELTVGASLHDGQAKIVVSDTGSGIEPAVQERMFEPFFSTKEVGSGSGLGLSIVHGIVKQLNGSIEVASSLGVGSSIAVYLPLCER